MATRAVLVYILSALSILIGILILLNDLNFWGVLPESILIRDMALVALGVAIGVAAPLLYRKFSSEAQAE